MTELEWHIVLWFVGLTCGVSAHAAFISAAMKRHRPEHHYSQRRLYGSDRTGVARVGAE
jgi:hypothetical protein